MSPRRKVALPSVRIDLTVEAGEWPGRTQLRTIVRTAVGAALAQLDLRSGVSELSVLFTDDAGIRRLNAEWRDKDKPTNVLSFPAFSYRRGDPIPPLLGDIALAQETIAREAILEDKTFEHHLTHLVIHGVLHLLGFDHETDDEAGEMEGIERLALAALAIADPYA